VLTASAGHATPSAVHPPGEPAGARSCVRTSRPGRNKCSPAGCCR